MQRKSVTISEKEIQLLKCSGSSLFDYNVPDTLFPDSQVLSFIAQLQGVGIKRIKTLKEGSNSALRIYYFCLLKEMFSLRHYSNTLMRRFKTLLFKQERDLSAIINVQTVPHLNNHQMKKLIIQFLNLVTYSRQGSRVEICLDRYPIVDTLLLIFMRTLLIGLVPRCEDFSQEIDLFVSYRTLALILQAEMYVTDGYIQLFDGSYHILKDNKNLHLVFFEERIVESICDSPAAMSPFYDFCSQSLSSARKFHNSIEENTPFFDSLTIENNNNFSKNQSGNFETNKGLFDLYAQRSMNNFLKKDRLPSDNMTFGGIRNNDSQIRENEQFSLTSTKKAKMRNTVEIKTKSSFENQQQSKPEMPEENFLCITRKLSLSDSNVTLPLFTFDQPKIVQPQVINRQKYELENQSFDGPTIDNLTKDAETPSAFGQLVDLSDETTRDSPLKISEHISVSLKINSSDKVQETIRARNNSQILKSKFRISFEYGQQIPFSPATALRNQQYSNFSSNNKTQFRCFANNHTIVSPFNTPTKARTPQASPSSKRNQSPTKRTQPILLQVSQIKQTGLLSAPQSRRTSRQPNEQRIHTQLSRTGPILIHKKVQPIKILNTFPHRYTVFRL